LALAIILAELCTTRSRSTFRHVAFRRTAARRVQPMMRWIVGSSLTFCLLAALTCLGLSRGVVMAQDKKLEDFDPKNFGPSTRIDNEWFPLKPGTRLVYTGTTIEDDGKRMPRRLVSI